MFQIDFHKDIQKDLELLPDVVYDEAVEYLEKFKIEPYRYTQKLGNYHGMDLSSLRKTYIANATYRIITRIIDNTIQVVEIVVIDEREDIKVYKKAFDRIFPRPISPEV
ncbi:MAG: hypothetical protein U9N33_01310 [Campylobacterota bacterium]|nr:hypothetical protein [Campylobacterota bacterium]